MAKRTGSLARIDTAALRRELARRQRRLGPLQRKQKVLLARAAVLGAEIAALGGDFEGMRRGPGRPPKLGGPALATGQRTPSGKRFRNEMNLVDALASVLKGKTMGVTEVSDAVQAAGYKTTSPNFRSIVNQALINKKNKRLFRKVARGRYTAA